MKLLQKIWNFFDKNSSIILIILMINLIITTIFTGSKGIYFWISDISLLILSLIVISKGIIHYFKSKYNGL